MNPVGERLAPGIVILGPVGEEYARRALVVALDLHRVHKRPAPADLLELADLLGVTASGSTSHAHPGSPALPQLAAHPSSAQELVDTVEAAQMLGCKVRNVRYLRARGVLAGDIVRGRLLFTRAEILAEAARREARCA